MLKKLKTLYNQLFPGFSRELYAATKGMRTVLDVGCGFPSPIAPFAREFVYSVGVDAFLPSIQKSKAQGIHTEYVQADVLDIAKRFSPQSFECVICLDVIEHLPSAQGLELLQALEQTASRRVIIFTPNGFLPQPAHSNNPWQEHRSGWTVEQMERLGYRVIGINGWKPLRGAFAYIRFRPVFFWRIISDFTQRIVRNRPIAAFQLLCIKDLPQSQV